MANLIYDGYLSFGKMAPLATGEFPNVLNLGKKPAGSDHYPGKGSTNADRMTVDIVSEGLAGGTTLTVTVSGSQDGTAGSWKDVGKHDYSLDEIKAGPIQTAISQNPYQYIKVAVVATGVFSGSAEAFLNTYAGK